MALSVSLCLCVINLSALADPTDTDLSDNEQEQVNAAGGTDIYLETSDIYDLKITDLWATLTEAEQANGQWSSLDDSIASVENGIVTGNTAGDTQIVFEYTPDSSEQTDSSTEQSDSDLTEENNQNTDDQIEENTDDQAEIEDNQTEEDINNPTENDDTDNQGEEDDSDNQIEEDNNLDNQTEENDSDNQIEEQETEDEEIPEQPLDNSENEPVDEEEIPEISVDDSDFEEITGISEFNDAMGKLIWDITVAKAEGVGLAATIATENTGTITLSSEIPDFGQLGASYSLLDWVVSATDANGDDIKNRIIVDSISENGVTYGEGDWYAAYDEANCTLTTSATNGAVYTIVYAVYDNEIMIAEKVLTFTVNANVTGARLDGDYAYISSAKVTDISTGTAPWDICAYDGNNNPGCDNSNENLVLRTFDTATYTLTIGSKARDGAPYKAYDSGTLYFSFGFEKDISADEVIFDVGSMAWIAGNTEGQYSYDETSNTLTGSILLTKTSEKAGAAIGEALQTLTVVIRVLSMKNGDTLTPTFTFWLEGNGESDYFISETEATVGEDDVTSNQITVTAVPNYNVQVVNADYNKHSTSGTFDFGTAGPNQESGLSVTGRLVGYGVMVEILARKDGEGKTYSDLRGVELPEEDRAITFTLQTYSQYNYTPTGSDTTTTVYSPAGYTPLFYSVEGNKKDGNEGRSLDPLTRTFISFVPFNTTSKISQSYQSIGNGGTWTVTDATGSEANTDYVQVSISGYDIDLSKSPYTMSGQSTTIYTYYTPSSNWTAENGEPNWWEITEAVVSSGEVWIVQPFTNTTGDGRTLVEEYGDGTVTLRLEDRNLNMVSLSDQNVSSDGTTQADTTDDFKKQSFAVTSPGTLSQQVAYVKANWSGYNDALTDGCYENGYDWIIRGDKLAIQGLIYHNGADDDYISVAFDELIKFDDELFEPDGNFYVAKPTSLTPTLYWAGKGGGWSSDEEMKNATTDDLIFYSTLDALKEAGMTCVGTLVEYRGAGQQTTMEMFVYITGTCKSTAELGSTYMISPYARAWSKSQLTKANLSAIPSVDTNGKAYSETEAWWRNGGSDGNSSQTTAINSYTKAAYDKYGQLSNSPTAGRNWGDSCVVVPYGTDLTVKIAQRTTSTFDAEAMGDGELSGQRKAVFDLDLSQRYVDIRLDTWASTLIDGGSSSDTGTDTTVTVTVTLPSGVNWDGTAYYGGTYADNIANGGTEGTAYGTVIDGQVFGKSEGYTVKSVTNSDGSTTLTFTFPETIKSIEKTEFEPIYLFAHIEDAALGGNEQTSLTISSIVRASGENKAEGMESASSTTITAIKNSGLSLLNIADENRYILESAEDNTVEMSFTMNVVNSSKNSAVELLTAITMPQNGLNQSKFNGACSVENIEFVGLDNITNCKIYYTTSGYYTSGEVYDMNLSDSTVWLEYNANSDISSATTFVVTGFLATGKTLDVKAVISLDSVTGGEIAQTIISNTNTLGDIISYSQSYVVKPVEFQIPVAKTIMGISSTEDVFTFTLTDENNETKSATIEGVEGTDETEFETIKYTEAGAYTYTVVETPGDSTDWKYDDSKYIVTVNVTETDGILSAAISKVEKDGEEISVEDGITFLNMYTAVVLPVTGSNSGISLGIAGSVLLVVALLLIIKKKKSLILASF